jgi:death-on-curing protein
MPPIPFLALADVLLIHHDQIARYGGLGAVRDFGLLSSAVAQPAATFSGEYLHTDLFEMAAAHTYYICQDHPFADGNKRTALASALVFLDINGVEIEDPKQRLYSAMMGVASGKKTKRDIANLLRQLGSAAPAQ